MKFTSEDLMKAMGLQVGDKVKIVDGTSYEVVLYNEIYQIKGIENQGILLNIYSLLNVDYEILPRPKRVGDMLCEDFECDNCPLRCLPYCNQSEDAKETLFNILEGWNEYDYFDQEIYDLLKVRLDKKVNENE